MRDVSCVESSQMVKVDAVRCGQHAAARAAAADGLTDNRARASHQLVEVRTPSLLISSEPAAHYRSLRRNLFASHVNKSYLTVTLKRYFVL
ncbi:hypothetical protein RR46_03755 [Papilio xuthus]|uniref:Uncharacterized protein n=1 Tax=Papilio xuthus TaxID=66420 RepID=A0A194Q7K9_PAPXU|nr:hypothetical protein RR46_03755 [Papilio xuthus]